MRLYSGTVTNVGQWSILCTVKRGMVRVVEAAANKSNTVYRIAKQFSGGPQVFRWPCEGR